MYLHAVVECHEVGMFSQPAELCRICGHVAHVTKALLCTLTFLVVSSDCVVLGRSWSSVKHPAQWDDHTQADA